MKNFDQRWQTLAQSARPFPEELSGELPLGFATRVLARARETSGEAWEDVFNFLGLRAVLATAALFILSSGFAFSDWFDARIEPPTLDSTVTAELAWP